MCAGFCVALLVSAISRQTISVGKPESSSNSSDDRQERIRYSIRAQANEFLKIELNDWRSLQKLLPFHWCTMVCIVCSSLSGDWNSLFFETTWLLPLNIVLFLFFALLGFAGILGGWFAVVISLSSLAVLSLRARAKTGEDVVDWRWYKDFAGETYAPLADFSDDAYDALEKQVANNEMFGLYLRGAQGEIGVDVWVPAQEDSGERRIPDLNRPDSFIKSCLSFELFGLANIYEHGNHFYRPVIVPLEHDWFEYFKKYIDTASVVVLYFHRGSSGLNRELEYILQNKKADKTLVLTNGYYGDLVATFRKLNPKNVIRWGEVQSEDTLLEIQRRLVEIAE